MLSHVPPWVLFVFVALVVLGLWFARPRAVSPLAPTIMAFAFPAYSSSGVVASFGPAATPVLAWALGLMFCVFLRPGLFGPTGRSRVAGTNKVRVPGSWLPMALMMGIFGVRFAVGFVQGARLRAAGQPWFAPTASFLLGALSGGFAARALTIRRFVENAGRPA